MNIISKIVKIVKKNAIIIKDVIIPICSIVAMIYCASKASTINLNVTNTENKEPISPYEANEFMTVLSNKYNEVLDLFKYSPDDDTIDLLTNRLIGLRTSWILDDIFKDPEKILKSEFDEIESLTSSSLFKGFKNTDYENAYYKHKKMLTYPDSIVIVDPMIVKKEGNEEHILRELPSKIYKVEKVEKEEKEEKDVIENDKEYDFNIIDATGSYIIDNDK